jgi:ectoine hydroxylase-related dioxygenase (phytanoyl-CoA dioxygenase family)
MSLRSGPTSKKPTHPPSYVLNVPLVDVTDDNGATICWPGSHRDTRTAQKNRFPTQNMLRDYPALRLHSQMGDLVIRDTRLWHGGMPNRTDQPRPMIAMGHVKPFFTGGVEFEKGNESFFDHPILTTRATFAEPPIRYLYQGLVQPG